MMTTPLPPGLIAAIRGLACWAGAASAVCSLSVAADGDAPVSAPKDHVLFMGLDVFVTKAQADTRIRRVSHGAVEMGVPGEARSVSLQSVSEYAIVREPKVSETTVTIADARGARRFSAGNDPMLEATYLHAVMDDVMMDQQEQYNRAVRRMSDVNDYVGSPSADPAVAAAAGAEHAHVVAAARENVAEAGHKLSTGQYDDMHPIREAGEAGDNAPYDAFDVTFQISSPERIEDAYAVLVAVIRVPGNPKVPATAVSVSELPVIDQQPRKIHLTHPGLPPGFGVDGFEIHVYAPGRELGTSLSEKRVELTRSEACQFLVLRRQMEHRTGEVAPVLAKEFVPADFSARVPVGERGREVDLEVDASGDVTRCVLAPGGSPEVDAYIESVARVFWFLPALRNGAAVPGKTTMTLGEFLE